MLITATQNYTRQSSRKVRLVANTIKKLPLEKALQELGVIEKKATQVVTKTLQQAIGNAMHNHGFQFADLAIESIMVSDGPRYKRFRAVSRGRAHNIVKKTCHVKVVLKTVEAVKEAVPVKEVKTEPVKKSKTEKKK